MRAAFINAVGPPSAIQIGALPTAEPGPEQVRVRVAATSVNPIDLYLRSGAVAMPMAFPYVVGSDLAGAVESVGSSVTRFKPGDRVWASNQGLLGRQGCTSDFVVVDEEWLQLTPAGVPDAEAAAMALVGITAHLGLFERARLKAGETVFVTGGSGGVGTMAIQMAKAAGARVITTASTDEKGRLCRSLGADHVINYKTDDITGRLRGFSESGVDVWFETQREFDLETNIPLMRKNGRMVLIAGRAAKPVFPVGPFYTRNASLLGFAMFNYSAEEQRPCGDDINRWAAEGKLRAVIGRVFSLDQAADAHHFLEESTLHGAGQVVGKVVIAVA